MQNIILNITLLLLMSLSIVISHAQYTMPIEIEEHEGTWLQWPHNNLYGPYYRDDLKTTFVEMTRELVKGENVHIIAYDNNEKNYIIQTLNNAGVSLAQVDFVIRPNDDCWVRDNGPIFVYDENNELVILDWGFNGWGNDTPYQLCNTVPSAIANEMNLPSVDLNNMVIEGGAFEIDGNGAFLATKSSILGDDRNPNLTQEQVENYLTDHIGVSHFIWLEGVSGLEITDMHIDGFARFHDEATIVTMNTNDLDYWQVPSDDIHTLLNATNIDGLSYDYVYLPLTQNDVRTTWGQNLGYKGSYVNYYIANAVVLIPSYNDPNDAVARAILQDIYPNKEVVSIDVRNLYSNGGMIHCVTQQQPLPPSILPVKTTNFEAKQEDCQVTLTWVTSVEIQLDKFIVERSADNKSFYSIGQINAQNSLSQNSFYHFIDEQPLAVNYYRLRQMDIDGKSDFSSVITARKVCDGPLELTLNPTITNDFSILKIKNERQDKLEVRIFSAFGMLVQSFNVENGSQFNEVRLDVADFPNGMYYVQVRTLRNLYKKTLSLVIAK